MQRLLRTAVWDDGRIGDQLREFVVARLGHRDAVLVVDETGYLKKGLCSVGVQRHYSGTAGRLAGSSSPPNLGYVLAIARNQYVQATESVRLRPDDYQAAIRWSWWRRRHQATARRSHYKHRDAATGP